MCCGLAAVLGHVWPVYHGFKGGKGAATFIGTLTIIAPTFIIGLLLVWATVVALTGYVGLATMTAATALPLWVAVTGLELERQPLFLYLALVAACIIYWHRSNIRRMRDGVEHRNRKLMLFKPKNAPGGDEQA